ncbi:MAG: hypothetical protein AAGE52_43155, partial [Myxococcota bacterium]
AVCDLTRAVSEDEVREILEDAAGWTTTERGTDLDASLATREFVLLDNAEHVVGFLRALLADLTSARFVVTSRVPLSLPRERVLELQPLGDSPALALFLTRARRRASNFAATDLEREACANIVEVVGGCPLALELAASRAARSSAEGLLRELKQSGLAVLRSQGELTLRFTTLHEALHQSWRLLSPSLQNALVGLSILRGSWSQQTASVVLGLNSADTLDILDALRDRSVVQMDPLRPSLYRVYETVREYALRHAPPDERVRALHRLSQTRLARRAGPAMFALCELPDDALNLRVLFEGHLAHGEASLALQALLRMRVAYLCRGAYRAYDQLLAALETKLRNEEDRLLFTMAQAELAGWRGEFPRAAALTEKALAQVENDAEAEALLLAQLGSLQGALYNPAHGTALLERAQHRLPKNASPELAAYVHRQLAIFLLLQDPAEAERRLERVLGLARQLQHDRAMLQTLALLAISRIARGSRESARAAVQEAAALFQAGASEDASPKNDERWRIVLSLIEGA